jgi:CHASE2 domain-containing sensor protein/tRNA A-37 threonylcarbamoyl transferase component Bud32
MSRRILAVVVGIAVPLIGLVLLSFGAVSSQVGYSTLLKAMGPKSRSSREGAAPVVLVDIDNAAQDAQGPWPWPSYRIDALIQAVATGGARAIVLDKSLFSDPAHSPTPALWATLPAGIAVVVPSRTLSAREKFDCRLWTTPSGPNESGFPSVEPQGLPEGVPCDERIQVGIDSLSGDPTGLSIPLVWNDGRHLVPSLALSALLASAPNGMAQSWWESETRSVEGVHGRFALDPAGSLLLRPFGAPGQGVPSVNAAAVLDNVESGLFQGRVVVVGVTSLSLVPSVDIPFSAPLAGNHLPRAEVTASMLQGMMDQVVVREPSWAKWVGWGFLLLAAGLVALGLGRSRRRWTSLSLLASMATGIVFWWLAFGLDLWFSPLAVVLPSIGALAAALLWPKEGETSKPRRESNPNLPPRPQRSRDARSPSVPAQGTTTLEIPVVEGDGEQLERGPNGDLIRMGRYVGLSPIGTGGMCKVYMGHDPVMDRKVAIKILRADKSKGQTTEQRFLREARIAGSLHHPNINTVFDFGQADDLLYLVLEFVEGDTLAQWVKEHNGVRPKAIVPWVRQIADALDTAHASQVVHRDVKPSNFMIVKQSGAIKLMDFGVARTPDVTLTQAGTTVGTPNYMSPEQLQGSKVGPSSDLYSFGVVVYQILSQRLPFHGEGLTALCGAILKGNCTKLSVHRPDLSGPVEQVVHKAFAVKADDRYASGADFAEAFERAVGI